MSTHPSRPPTDRPWRFVVTAQRVITHCDACDQPIEIGARAGIYSEWPVITHFDGCPPRWTPRLITGAGEPTEQLSLRLLTPVPDRHAATTEEPHA